MWALEKGIIVSYDLMFYNLGQVKFSGPQFSYLKIGIITACSKA